MKLRATETPLELYIEENRLLRKPEILELLNISRATLYRWIKKGAFPPPAFIQSGQSVWHFKDYLHWLERHHRTAG